MDKPTLDTEANKLAFKAKHDIDRPEKCVICNETLRVSWLSDVKDGWETEIYCPKRENGLSHYQLSPDGSWLFYLPLHGHPSYRILTAYRDISIYEDVIVAQPRSTVIEPPVRTRGDKLIIEPLSFDQHSPSFITHENIEMLRLFQ